MFRTEHESDNEQSFEYLNNFILKNQINPKQIYVINNNDRLEEYKVKYNSDINVHKTEFLASSSTIVLVNLEDSKFIPNKDGKFFMCFNKTPKSHRKQKGSYVNLTKSNEYQDEFSVEIIQQNRSKQ